MIRLVLAFIGLWIAYLLVTGFVTMLLVSSLEKVMGNRDIRRHLRERAREGDSLSETTTVTPPDET